MFCVKKKKRREKGNKQSKTRRLEGDATLGKHVTLMNTPEVRLFDGGGKCCRQSFRSRLKARRPGTVLRIVSSFVLEKGFAPVEL